MKSLIVGFSVVLSVAAATLLFADDPPVATQPAPTNTKCPVSDEAVSATARTATYQNKAVGFCCDDCVGLFNKNPEKYADKLK